MKSLTPILLLSAFIAICLVTTSPVLAGRASRVTNRWGIMNTNNGRGDKWKQCRGGAEAADTKNTAKVSRWSRKKRNNDNDNDNDDTNKKTDDNNIDDNNDDKESSDKSTTTTTTESDDKSDNENKKYVFSVFQPGDGSDQDPDNIPRKFLAMAKGNREAAMTALATTQEWRLEHKVDTILQTPHPNFEICKIITPHSFLGRDASGHVVFFQRPAKDSGEHLTLATKNHMSNDDLLLHYVYVLEYCWNILDPPQSQLLLASAEGAEEGGGGEEEEIRTMTSILDLTGLDLSILRHRDLIGFVKQFVQMTSIHYPQRSYKTLLLNAPSWFGMLYKLISPLLRESTRAKVTILSHGKQQVETLRDVLGDDCLKYLPPELLETDKVSKSSKNENDNKDVFKVLPISPMEQDLRDFCLARLQEAGMEMNPLKTDD